MRERRAVAQAPSTQVQARLQAEVAAVAALAAVVVGAVVDEGGGDAVVAQFRCHEATRGDGLGRLRNTQGQLQLAAVKGGTGALHQRGQIHTGVLFGRQGLKKRRLQWQPAYQHRRKAWHRDLRVVLDDKADVLAAQELAVHMHVHRVIASRQRIAVGVARQVDGFAADQEAFAELDGGCRGVQCKSGRQHRTYGGAEGSGGGTGTIHGPHR